MLIDVSLEEAQKIILSNIPDLAVEDLPLLESSGRVLATDYYAGQDLPLQARSAVDGYAVGSGEAPVNSCFLLKRCPPSDEDDIAEGEAMAVTTGGTLPTGTKAVVTHEKTTLNNNKLTVLETIKPGNNIKTGGEDFHQGELLASNNTALDAGTTAVLAAFGFSQVAVRRRPRVAILGLGNDIVSFHASPEPHQIRDSNGPMLAAMVRQDGGEPLTVEVASSVNTAEKLLAQMLQQADLVLCTGGTYAQGGDEARLLMESLGIQLFYWGVPIQPGSHHGAGRYGSCLVLALSGNPAACAVGYQLFVTTALRAMQGLIPHHQLVKARCTTGFAKKSGSRRFVRGRAQHNETGWQVEVLPGQKPSMLKSLLNCNALIDLPAGRPPVEPGEVVTAWLL